MLTPLWSFEINALNHVPDSTILLICSKSDLSGAPIHVACLAEALSERGEDVHVLYSGSGEAFASISSISRHVLPGLDNGASLAETLRAVSYISALIRDKKPRIVHVHSTKAGLVSRLSALLCSIKIVFTVHGWGFGPGRPILNSMISLAAELLLGAPATAAYICVSRADFDQGKKRLPWLRPRMLVVRNGLRDSPHVKRWPYCLSGPSTILMVARVSRQKNHEVLAGAFNLLEGQWRLLLAGGGTEELSFQQNFLSKLSTEKRDLVTFLGPRKDVERLLAESDIFVLTSRFEGLPLSIIEAMRAGLPVIASDVGGNRELINGNGFLVERGANEADGVCKALERLADIKVRKNLGQVSRHLYLEEFSFNAMLSKTLEVYERNQIKY